ncbi:MAG: hypothetical protein IPL34_20300 [Thiofilum sp.]|uniref:hypothetical protein n=1 Tax=Thiofilum sp. TaxID=2212733 RepID=UPI0025EC51FF|nr:hypothetical protein [Thiofilum sp.]MBK8455624.1 hypothetical protein [Thiofilum sp.]
MEIEYLTCPLCKENDFDDIGLYQHYSSGYCDGYNKAQDKYVLMNNELCERYIENKK